MTREDAKKLLGENATDEQVTNLLNAVHTEINAKDKEINNLNNTIKSNNTEIANLKKSDDELRQIKESQMTEQEKAKELQDQLNAQMSTYKKLSNSVKAKSILVGAGISGEKADSLVSKFVKEDEQATIDLANEIVQELSDMKAATEKKVKDDLSNVNVNPTTSNVNPKTDDLMTWDKFTKLSSEEQNKFQEEHPEEFNNL